MPLPHAEMETLRIVARDGHMDYDRWPTLLNYLTTRLNEIARAEFPIPQPSFLESQPAEPSRPASRNHEQPSESADKENAPPNSDAANHVAESDDPLPREILVRLNSVIATLATYFQNYPPHTVQRLSELILEPRRHYKTLPAYLHALDRVVNVTSGANTYPLPAASPTVHTNGNGAASNSNNVAWSNSTSAQSALGSDESLGGALLTPIPWLVNGSSGNGESAGSNPRSASAGPIEREVRTQSTQTIEGPNGAGSIETVTVSVFGPAYTNPTPTSPSTSTAAPDTGSAAPIASALRADGGVTQGELIRQEQQLNIVPATPMAARLADAEGEDDEIPHARGPEEVGVADMGPQGPRADGPILETLGINVEAAVGRRADVGVVDGSKSAAGAAGTVTHGKEREEDGERGAVPGETAEGTEEAGVMDNVKADEAAVPRTPKREAEEDPPEDRHAKRNKSDDAGAESQGGGGVADGDGGAAGGKEGAGSVAARSGAGGGGGGTEAGAGQSPVASS